MGSFNAWAVTYNDTGSGPLHMGTALCAGGFNDLNGSYDADGWCAWGDASGDKIFTTFTGKGTDNVGEQGAHTIIGGTGKFAGIQGKGMYQCKNVNPSQSSIGLHSTVRLHVGVRDQIAKLQRQV